MANTNGKKRRRVRFSLSALFLIFTAAAIGFALFGWKPKEKAGQYQYLGIFMLNANILVSVTPKSPAEDAGLLAGDAILELNGEPIANDTDVWFAAAKCYFDQVVHVKLRRGDKVLTRNLTIGDAREYLPTPH